MKEKDLIKVIGVDWENVRKKLCSSEIEYNDIPRLKKENFFKWFDDMLTTSEDKAVTKLSNINLFLSLITLLQYSVSDSCLVDETFFSLLQNLPFNIIYIVT